VNSIQVVAANRAMNGNRMIAGSSLPVSSSMAQPSHRNSGGWSK
jgi:hypothetical protein